MNIFLGQNNNLEISVTAVWDELRLGDYKFVSWVYGVDRKFCHEGHWSTSRGLPSEAE